MTSVARDRQDAADGSINASVAVAVTSPERAEDLSLLKIYPHERESAKQIKAAIAAIPELDDLSDFMYAQMAICILENTVNQDEVLADAIHRAHCLQAFREEYRIANTYQDGVRAVRQWPMLFPDTLLYFGKNSDGSSYRQLNGSYVLIMDYAKMDTTSLNTRERKNTYFATSYYTVVAIGPDLDSARRGFTWIAECEGMGYFQKQDFKLFHKLSTELFEEYPIAGRMVLCNAGVVFNTLFSATKRLLPFDIRDGCDVLPRQDGSRLSDILLSPTPEAATERVVQKLEETLKLRFDNERRFSLDDDAFLFGDDN